MCNLYSASKGQAAIRHWFRVARDLTGNLPPMPGVSLNIARWGMPSSVFAMKGRTTDPGVTNVRNVKSPHWAEAERGANRSNLEEAFGSLDAAAGDMLELMTKARPLKRYNR